MEFRVLVVDDEELWAQAIGDELSRRRVTVDLAFSCAEALSKVQRGHYHVILLDHRLPDEEGLKILPRLLSYLPTSAVLMMTAYHAIPDAVQAIRQGAEDYLVKETSILPIAERVMEIQRREQARATTSGWKDHHRGGLLGRSSHMVQVVEQLKKAVQSPETTVLLSGETGVGKEVAARYLHRITQPATTRPFVAVDCVALPGNLVESLLFGHERGAFTGADQVRPGAFEEARDGTVLLDEIGDMDEVQGKLLRVLESRVFARVGSVKEIPLRARVVAATNQDLKLLVKSGRFRHDLYQRLCVFPIHIPALRERGEDVVLLAQHFADFFASKLCKEIDPIGPEVRSHLLAYRYPGNVRELKNIIERAVIMTDTGQLEPRHLPRRVLAESAPINKNLEPSVPLDFEPGVDTLESLEKRMIQQALKRANYVKTEAARLLGISRFQLQRRMERHNIDLKKQ